jgi:hypothetical protein
VSATTFSSVISRSAWFWPGRRAALVVGEHDLDLGAAETGKPGPWRAGNAELGMVVVDDVDATSTPPCMIPALAALPLREDRADLDGLLRDCAPDSASDIVAAASSPSTGLKVMWRSPKGTNSLPGF